jgi:glycosyltransferase involved in cell wall biosynthesis
VRIVVANSFHYRRGGDSNHFLDLIAELERRGHDVAVFSMQHPQNLPSRWSEYWVPYVEFRGDLTVLDRVRAGWRSVRSAESGRKMTSLLADFKPDVVHFHSVQHHLTLAAVEACLSAPIPVVWTLHDYRTVCPATSLLRATEVCERCAGGRFWHGIAGRCKSGEVTRSLASVAESYLARLRRTLGRVDCYVAPSRFLASKVVEMGLPARRIEIVPNPVYGEAAPVDAGERRGLLYVGRLSAEKGVDCLIEAVAGLENATLSVVGDGPELERLSALADSLDADVSFEGWADATGVRARMGEAELLCVPSVWYENCPGVVLEAVIAGLPVVASDIGGLTELLEEGQAGWLAPPGDPAAWCRTISKALGDKARTAQQATRAFARVRARHDPERYVQRIEGIYRSLQASPLG